MNVEKTGFTASINNKTGTYEVCPARGEVASCTLFEARSAYAVGMQLKIDVFGELNPEVASAHSHARPHGPCTRGRWYQDDRST